MKLKKFILTIIFGSAAIVLNAQNINQITDNTVLATMEGKPIITVDEVKKASDVGMLAHLALPDAYEMLLHDILIHTWLEKQGITQSADYQKELQVSKTQMRSDSAVRSRTDQILFAHNYPPVQPTKNDLKQLYEQNLSSQEGITSTFKDILLNDLVIDTLVFDDTESMKAFYRKAIGEANLNEPGVLKTLAEKYTIPFKTFDLSFNDPRFDLITKWTLFADFFYVKETLAAAISGRLADKNVNQNIIMQITGSKQIRDKVPTFEEFYTSPEFSEIRKSLSRDFSLRKLGAQEDSVYQQLKQAFNVQEHNIQALDTIVPKAQTIRPERFVTEYQEI